MSRIEISGMGIEYELLGLSGAHAIAVTPGGRFGKDNGELGLSLYPVGDVAGAWHVA